MDITGSKSYNINVSFHININSPRPDQRWTGVCKLFPFIFGVGNSIVTICTYITAYRQIIKYNENYVYLSSLSLPKELSDITSMDEDSVAVASLSSDDIYLINIKTMT
jgi:hypothetical protein